MEAPRGAHLGGRSDRQQLLTKPYSPTTIGKVERWHQGLQTDFLTDAGPFATIEDAQAAAAGPAPAARALGRVAQPRQQLGHHLRPGLRGHAVFTSGSRRSAAIMSHDLRRRGRQRPRLATGPGGAG